MTIINNTDYTLTPTQQDIVRNAAAWCNVDTVCVSNTKTDIITFSNNDEVELFALSLLTNEIVELPTANDETTEKLRIWAAEINKEWMFYHAYSDCNSLIVIYHKDELAARIDYNNGRYTVTGIDKQAVHQLEYMVNR